MHSDYRRAPPHLAFCCCFKLEDSVRPITSGCVLTGWLWEFLPRQLYIHNSSCIFATMHKSFIGNSTVFFFNSASLSQTNIRGLSKLSFLGRNLEASRSRRPVDYKRVQPLVIGLSQTSDCISLAPWLLLATAAQRSCALKATGHPRGQAHSHRQRCFMNLYFSG